MESQMGKPQIELSAAIKQMLNFIKTGKVHPRN